MEGGMAGHGLRAQRELFTAVTPSHRLPPEVRCALLTLLETLLREAAGEATDQEGSDEQDHA
jgi:hypothetical protein